MTRRLVLPLLVLGLLLVAPRTLLAKQFVSGFGFVTTVPDGWLILSRSELRENADLFDNLADRPGMKNADPRMLASVQSQIRAGMVELLFHVEGSRPSFADNVNVVKQIGRIPEAGELRAYCAQASSELTAALGRPVSLYRCELAKNTPVRSVYIEYDGLVPGSRGMAYAMRKSDNVYVLFTATAASENAGRVRSDLDVMVRNLRFQ